MVIGLVGCSTLPVSSNPDEAPSFSASILWLNDYFRDNEIRLAVAEDRVHFDKAPAGAHSGGRARSLWRYRKTRNIHMQYVNRSILLLGRATVFARFDVADNAEGLAVVQRLMVIGVQYNRAARLRPYACLNGQPEACPQYPDDGNNRRVAPFTAPCEKRTCPTPR